MNVQAYLEEKISVALKDAGAPPGVKALVKPSTRPEFGDYQANGVMAAARAAGVNPRHLAQSALSFIQAADFAEKIEVAGPGFINIFLSDEWVACQIEEAFSDPRLGVSHETTRLRIVVDYSSPNLAKEMHVGHLRSTIIGDAMVRILTFLGHEVIPQNHVGDWGTQFGMLLAYMEESESQGRSAVSESLSDLEAFYVKAKARFDSDPVFAEASREAVVRLQSGDKQAVARWREFIDISLSHCEAIYKRLGVLLSRDDVRGESFYETALPEVIEELGCKGLLKEDQGALCVFLDEFRGRDGAPLPALIRKRDGGYLYMATDLAALRYRCNVIKADRILYVIDARQSLHLQQLFAIGRKAGLASWSVCLEHASFGTVMGKDGRPLRTRSGGTPKLSELLDEAEERAFALVTKKNPGMPQAERREIARAVGISAVKYADLSKSRVSDYIFDVESMTSFDGNTAPYLLYAYTRVMGIFRKGNVGEGKLSGEVVLVDRAERGLAIHLLRFPETIKQAASEAGPHHLCGYLYVLAGLFMKFYEGCPVLEGEGSLRESRLKLSLLAARTLSMGLSLLGIGTLDRM